MALNNTYFEDSVTVKDNSVIGKRINNQLMNLKFENYRTGEEKEEFKVGPYMLNERKEYAEQLRENYMKMLMLNKQT